MVNKQIKVYKCRKCSTVLAELWGDRAVKMGMAFISERVVIRCLACNFRNQWKPKVLDNGQTLPHK